MWKVVRQTHSDLENTVEQFDLESSLINLKQGDGDVTQFFNKLCSFWQQLDIFEELDWDCVGNCKRYRKVVEKKRIFVFLNGLDKNLDDVRGRILALKPLPPIREVFALVRLEEIRKKVMLKDLISPPIMLAAKGSALSTQASNSQASEGHGCGWRPWCDHCSKPGHTKDSCWKLHGRPANWKPRNNPSANNSPFSKNSFKC